MHPYPTKEELRVRLLMELSRSLRIELISALDFKRLLVQSEFQCPKFKNIKGLCLYPGRSCPARPRPCETCQSWKRYKRVFKAKNATQPRIDEAFEALQKICGPCELPNRHYDESDYMDECLRAISARQKLERIDQGEIQVKQSEGPLFD
jgi:hypothetical protein